jgi:hypothetical protein
MSYRDWAHRGRPKDTWLRDENGWVRDPLYTLIPLLPLVVFLILVVVISWGLG